MWRNIRDTYLRSLKKSSKSGQVAAPKRQYIYAQQLLFLRQAWAVIETQSSIEGSRDVEHENELKESLLNKEESALEPHLLVISQIHVKEKVLISRYL